jgi:hypothetical protein
VRPSPAFAKRSAGAVTIACACAFLTDDSHASGRLRDRDTALRRKAVLPAAVTPFTGLVAWKTSYGSPPLLIRQTALASRILRSDQLGVETKPDQTPITQADVDIELAIGHRLRAGSSIRSMGRAATCAAYRCLRRCWPSSSRARARESRPQGGRRTPQHD